MVHIYLDAMGGDNAPQCTIEGALEALRADKDLKITLGGPKDEIEKRLTDCGDVRDRIAVDDCPEIITNHEAPVMAIRQKKQSAQVKGMLLVRQGGADGFVSAGSTGATLAGGMFRLGRIEGVERPALAPLLPNGKGYFCLIDCGANVDCLPAYLPQFGVMGAAYVKAVLGIDSPRVGLVNIGAEAEKGNALVKETYPLMEKAPYNFIGNVEARDVPLDQADVCVTDGFGGNLILKYTEGLASALMGLIKQELMADTRGKIAGLIAKPAFRRVKKAMSSDEIGGAPLLGVQGAVVKAHGSSNDYAFCSAIGQCVKMIEGQVAQIIAAGVARMNPEEK